MMKKVKVGKHEITEQLVSYFSERSPTIALGWTLMTEPIRSKPSPALFKLARNPE